MNYPQYVKTSERIPLQLAAFKACRDKTLRKQYTAPKVGEDEKRNFLNCISKYTVLGEYADNGVREGYLIEWWGRWFIRMLTQGIWEKSLKNSEIRLWSRWTCEDDESMIVLCLFKTFLVFIEFGK